MRDGHQEDEKAKAPRKDEAGASPKQDFDPSADTFMDFASLFMRLPEEPFDLTAKIMARIRALGKAKR